MIIFAETHCENGWWLIARISPSRVIVRNGRPSGVVSRGRPSFHHPLMVFRTISVTLISDFYGRGRRVRNTSSTRVTGHTHTHENTSIDRIEIEWKKKLLSRVKVSSRDGKRWGKEWKKKKNKKTRDRLTFFFFLRETLNGRERESTVVILCEKHIHIPNELLSFDAHASTSPPMITSYNGTRRTTIDQSIFSFFIRFIFFSSSTFPLNPYIYKTLRGSTLNKCYYLYTRRILPSFETENASSSRVQRNVSCNGHLSIRDTFMVRFWSFSP